jgi:hypothetical protein
MNTSPETLGQMRTPTRQHNSTDALAPICDINEQCLQMLVEAARTSQSADEPFVHQLLSFIKSFCTITLVVLPPA